MISMSLTRSTVGRANLERFRSPGDTGNVANNVLASLEQILTLHNYLVRWLCLFVIVRPRERSDNHKTKVLPGVVVRAVANGTYSFRNDA